MLHDVTSFDRNLHMFRDLAKPVNLEHLRFLRWLVEHGRLEPPAGRSSGQFAEVALTDDLRDTSRPTARE